MDFDSRGQRDKTEDGSQTLLKPIADYDERYPEYVEWLSYLNRAIPHGSPVLDLGCGSGVPCTKMLAENFEVTGLDISEAQVEQAKKNVPTGRFHCVDMTKVIFPDESFAGVVSFYSIIHVPIRRQKRLVKRISEWLLPGGYLLATFGHKVWGLPGQDSSDDDIVNIAWSHAGRETYLRWITEYGLYVHWHRFIHERSGGQTLICCSKINRKVPKRRGKRTIFHLSRYFLGGSKTEWASGNA